MKTIKSARHSKILGDFGELFIMYWLSKRNHEPVLVDYIGIDVISYDKSNGKRLGISVKSRTRVGDTEEGNIKVTSKQVQLVKEACNYFDCEPFFGCVIDKEKSQAMDIYLIPFEDVLRINEYSGKYLYIRFTDDYINQYKRIKDVIIINMNYEEI